MSMTTSLSGTADDPLVVCIQELLKASNQQLVLAESCTAGLAAARLGTVPGISEHFCGSAVVYQEGTKRDWLDIPTSMLTQNGAVSEQVAEQMALGSLDQTTAATLAVSITGHLGPDAPTDLDGQLFVGVALKQQPGEQPITVVNGQRLEPSSRFGRQQLAASLLLETVYRVLQVLDACQQLGQGAARICLLPHASADNARATGQVIFPGAFAPLHDGHREMIERARQVTERDVALEISLENVDKPELLTGAAVARIIPLSPATVWLTRAATFVEKAELFPGSTFVVGADTIARIGEHRYYDDDLSCGQAITKIVANGCRFLVFGRAMDAQLQTGCGDAAMEFQGLEDLQIPDQLREICEGVSEQEFRRDLSSRQQR